jgi:hypothetical protein
MDSGLIRMILFYIGHVSVILYVFSLLLTIMSVVRAVRSISEISKHTEIGTRGRIGTHADAQALLGELQRNLEAANLSQEKLVRINEELRTLAEEIAQAKGAPEKEVFTVSPPSSVFRKRITQVVADLANVEIKTLS